MIWGISENAHDLQKPLFLTLDPSDYSNNSGIFPDSLMEILLFEIPKPENEQMEKACAENPWYMSYQFLKILNMEYRQNKYEMDFFDFSIQLEESLPPTHPPFARSNQHPDSHSNIPISYIPNVHI